MRPIVPLLTLAVALTGCGHKATPVVSHGKPVSYWVKAMDDPNRHVRKKAVVALGHAAAADAAAVSVLVRALKDRDRTVRDAATVALFNLGPTAKPAVAALEEARQDNDATVRLHAGKALERIRGG